MKKKALILFKAQWDWNKFIISKISNFYEVKFLYLDQLKKNYLNTISQVNNFIIDNKIDNYSINYGGNLTLAKKGLQHFHMDGDIKKEMYLVSIATEDINLMNGPTEICAGSHKKSLSFLCYL